MNGLRNQMVFAVGTGIAVGVCSTVLVQRFISYQTNVALLIRKVDNIYAQLEQLKLSIEDKGKKRKGYFSIHPSSGEDDDDEFEEAIEGTDTERLQGFHETNNAAIILNRNKNEPNERKRLYDKADALLLGGDRDKQLAYNMLHDNFEEYRHDAEFLWRYCKAMYNTSLIVGAQGNTEVKKDLTFKALQAVTDALDIDQNNYNCHKWYAITVGSAGDYLSIQEKIKNGYKFKEHIEKAIDLNPEDPSSHYLLGRWCYGVYMLSWMERKVASTLFASPPTSTAEEALAHFLKAQSLEKTQWKENMLFIAKCYIQKSQYSEAADWLFRANVVPAISQDDRTAQTDIETLLSKYGSYRQ